MNPAVYLDRSCIVSARCRFFFFVMLLFVVLLSLVGCAGVKVNVISNEDYLLLCCGDVLIIGNLSVLVIIVL